MYQNRWQDVDRSTCQHVGRRPCNTDKELSEEFKLQTGKIGFRATFLRKQGMYIKQGAKASRDHFYKLRRETYLDWLYLSPQIEMNKDVITGRTGRYRIGRDEPIVKEGVASISVEDLSMVVVDEVEHRKLSRQHFTVGY